MNNSGSSLRRILSAGCVGAVLAANSFGQAANQPTAADVDTAKDQKVPVTVTKVAKSDEDVLQMDVFQVTSEKDQGYQATSTMSGTRLNSRLEDLAASITVVTMQQLMDTASTDINDVFRFELGTEGTYQWTDYTLDRGNFIDNVQNNPNGATRMRGLTAANVAKGGFSSSLPVDTYNINSVEISRGSNSTIFGLGNTGGSVNLVPTRGNLTQDETKASFRFDNVDGFRSVLNLNRVLKPGLLAIRLDSLYEKKGFERKPSKEVNRRMTGGLTFKPFAYTTIRGSFESYRSFAQRPNSMTPRDMLTDWVSSGKPTWDPITQTMHLADGTSKTVAYSTNATTLKNNELAAFPAGLGISETGFQARSSWYIDQNAVQYYSVNRTPKDGTAYPTDFSGSLRLLQNSTALQRDTDTGANTKVLFNQAGLTDKSIYDYSSINLASPNYSHTKGEASTLELEQYLLRTPRQTLALQAGWYYERINGNNRSFLGNADGGKMQVYIDVNEKLLDGSPNPYFLRPYVGGSEPAFKKSRDNAENYRATLAYQLDLTREKNFLRWLGMQQFTGYAEYRSVYAGNFGFRDTISSNELWMPITSTSFSRNQSYNRVYPRYYVGDNQGFNVDYAPTGLAGAYGDYTYRYYDASAKKWVDEPVTFDEYYYANRLNRRIVQTVGGVWQGFLFKGRVIPLFGYRKDISKKREGNSAKSPSDITNGYYDTSDMVNFGNYEWVTRWGPTQTRGLVVKPFEWLHLNISRSNSFTPGSLVYDILGQPLSDPKGQTTDYGFTLLLFDGKLQFSARQYETYDYGKGSSSINTIVQRAIRLDADGNSDPTKGDPDLESWLTVEYGKLHPEWSVDQVATAVMKDMVVDPTFIDSHRNKTHSDDSDAYARGKEIEVIYNPTKYWTVKWNLVQQKAFNSGMSPKLQKYLSDRMPIWTSIKSPYDGSLWWTSTQAGSTPQSWFTKNVEAEMKLQIATQGKQRPQTREWRSNLITNFKFAGVTRHRILKNLEIGGSGSYESKGSIGYYGIAGSDGVIREYDANRPIWDKEHFTFNGRVAYNFRFNNDRYKCTLQLNVNNIFENGGLRAIAANPDGTPYAFRIIDPRRFILDARFQF